MYVPHLFFMLVITSSFNGQSAFGDADFVMKSSGNTPHMNLVDPKGDPIKNIGLADFTHCIYAYMETKPSKEYYTLVSHFSKKENRDVISVNTDFTKSGTFLQIYGNDIFISGEAKRDQWTHVCYTWSDTAGELKLYYDGTLIGSKQDVGINDKKIDFGDDCLLMLGQDQDEYDAQLQEEDGMWGRITHFNVWNRVLKENEIKCVKDGTLYGNVVDWRKASWMPWSQTVMVPSTAPLRLVDSSIGVCEKPLDTADDLDSFLFSSDEIEEDNKSEESIWDTVEIEEPIYEADEYYDSYEYTEEESVDESYETEYSEDTSSEYDWDSNPWYDYYSEEDDTDSDDSSDKSLEAIFEQFWSRESEYDVESDENAESISETPTDLSVCFRVLYHKRPLENTVLFHYRDKNKDSQLSFSIDQDLEANVAFGSQTRALGVKVTPAWQRLCCIWSELNFKLYVNGGLVKVIDDFEKGTYLPANGDLYTEAANSIDIEVIDYKVWKRAITLSEVLKGNEQKGTQDNVYSYQDVKYQSGSFSGKGLPYIPFPMLGQQPAPQGPQLGAPQVQVQQFAAPVQMSGAQQYPVGQNPIVYYPSYPAAQQYAAAQPPAAAQKYPAAGQFLQSNQLYPQNPVQPINNINN